ncbi:hypothetical protein KUTeg_013823 [Tegillarca granosa]|uniref:Laminin G domain-containing protein n=1 Tax=Tegillarca granosa TaxID=220873 RepID=A0ABQ9EUU2_TEGGR|nr:hypothetical protein KUTeg_013823 [Tegillarca granosa]
MLFQLNKVPPEVTLFGSQYFTYDLTSKGSGIDSSNDELNMYFRTTQPSGLLFFTGEGNSDYMNVALKNGGIIVTVNLGSGGYQGEIRPDRLSFDDNQWHHLRVTRETREIKFIK